MERGQFTVEQTAKHPTIALSVNAEEHDYNPNIAYISSFLSSWSYAGEQTLKAQLSKFGLGSWQVHLIGEDCDAMAIHAHGGLLVSPDGALGFLFFRGTKPTSITNWLTDTDVNHIPYRQCGEIHEGFYRNFEAVWPDLLDLIRNNKELRSLVVTGHSLGAAMAALVGMEIWYDPQVKFLKDKLVGVYTFGQPMLASPDLAKKCHDDGLGDRVFRHVYEHDVVPRLPPWSTGPLAHFGREFVNNDARWNERSRVLSQTISVTISGCAGLAAYVFGKIPVLGRIRLPFNFDDHFPFHYLSCSRPDGSAAHPGTPTDGTHRLIGGAVPIELGGGDGAQATN